MKKLIIIGVLAFGSVQLHAQQAFSNNDLKELQSREDSLRIQADSMINALNPGKRFLSDSIFVRMLVRALRTPH
jgi:hypothetical protein